MRLTPADATRRLSEASLAAALEEIPEDRRDEVRARLARTVAGERDLHF